MNINCYTVNLVFNQVADALGMDPVEVALLNDGAEGHDIEWLNAAQGRAGLPGEGQPAGSAWTRARPPSAGTRSGTRPAPASCPTARCTGWRSPGPTSGTIPPARARSPCTFERNDGSVTILGCRADVGVNAETTYCQIAADELGVPRRDGALQAPGRRRLLHHDPRHLHQPVRQRLGGAQRGPHPQAEAPGERPSAPRAKTQLAEFPAGLPRQAPRIWTSRTASSSRRPIPTTA